MESLQKVIGHLRLIQIKLLPKKTPAFLYTTIAIKGKIAFLKYFPQPNLKWNLGARICTLLQKLFCITPKRETECTLALQG